MGSQNSSLRYASPNERRVITREDLGYYRSLYIGGIYRTGRTTIDLTSKSTFLPGLRRCLKYHAPLSVIVVDPQTEKPYYTSHVIQNLENHINILPTVEDADGLSAIENASPGILDIIPSKDMPPWKIVVLPLAKTKDERPSRCFVAFAFSHALGDGIAGLAFHKSFLAGLQHPNENTEVAVGAMPPAFDTAKNLPISLSYLLAPALGAYLPKFIAKALGFRAAVSTITPSTWTGKGVVFLDTKHTSGAKLFSIDATTVAKLIQECRKHDTKFTSLLHQIIVLALSSCLPSDNGVDTFASQTAINMRHHVNVSNDDMGLFVSGFFDVHPRTTDSSKIWETARDMNEKLSAYSKKKDDHSIGLLRFLMSMRGWTGSKMGTRPDGSYEVSNLLAFDPGARAEEGPWSLENMVFAQPANVTASPLVFNVIARKGGDLVCAVTWQIGALGLGDAEKEYEFVARANQEILKISVELAS